MIRKILSLSAALAIVLVCAACSGSDSDGNATDNTENSIEKIEFNDET